MVRAVHTNHFYEISLRMRDPKIELLTKTHFLKKKCHVQNVWECSFWWKKSPCGVPPQQNKGFKHDIPINAAHTVQKVTIIKFIWPKITRPPENKSYNRINLLICVSGYQTNVMDVAGLRCIDS